MLFLVLELDDRQSEINVSVYSHCNAQECIKLGVRKFNVNTEVRKAYMDALSSPKKDLIHVMASAKEAMKAVIAEKMRLFGSAGKSC